MIINLKSTLDVVSLVGDFLTLLPALNHRQTPPAHTAGLSSLSGHLRPQATASSPPKSTWTNPAVHEPRSSSFLPVIAGPYPLTHLWLLFPLSSHLLRWNATIHLLCPLLCALLVPLTWIMPSNISAQISSNKNRKRSLSRPLPPPLWPHSGPDQIAQWTKYSGTLSHV